MVFKQLSYDETIAKFNKQRRFNLQEIAHIELVLASLRDDDVDTRIFYQKRLADCRRNISNLDSIESDSDFLKSFK